MNETSINTKMEGGAAGLVGVGVAHIENLYVGAQPALPPPPSGPIPACPYPGLAFFEPKDAARFFGRGKAITALARAVVRRGFTALVGASGSGKSSVVLAGLAPRLDAQGGWRSSYFRIGTEPDKNPFGALARALAPLLGEGDVVDRMARAQKLARSLATGEIALANAVAQCRAANPGKRILLIADQFEEVFTLVPDEALRNRFIDTLIAAFPDPGQGAAPDICLMLTLRADFYNAALRYRPLADRLQDHVENLGPMTRDELREAIVKPAEALLVGFDPGLVDAMLDDVEKSPGSLPLLQFALREMWGRLKTLLMTRADYDAIGGVQGALARRAQAIFDDATQSGRDETRVALFRRLFTRLVTLGEGAEDTRRIVRREELGSDAWALAQKLADEDNRLVVTAASTPEQETAEVVHEALIRNWPALVDWVNRDRVFQTWLRQLKPRVDEWRANPSDEGTLMRGGPLAVAEDWAGRRRDELSEDERAFISASADLRDAEKRQREQARLKEMAAAQATASSAQRRRRWTVGSISTACLALSSYVLIVLYYHGNQQRIISEYIDRLHELASEEPSSPAVEIGKYLEFSTGDYLDKEDIPEREQTILGRISGMRKYGDAAANLSGLSITDLDLMGIDLSGARLVNAEVRGVNLASTQNLRRDLANIVFDGSKISSTRFDGSDLSFSQFRNSKLTTVGFINSNLYRAAFDNAQLCDVALDGANLSRATFWNATMNTATTLTLGDTAWWLASGWSTDQVHEFLKQKPVELSQSAAFVQDRKTAENHVESAFFGDFARAIALNDLAWTLALSRVDLTNSKPESDSSKDCGVDSKIPSTAQDAAVEGLCIVDLLVEKSPNLKKYLESKAALEDTLGYIFLQSGQKEQALDLLKKAAETNGAETLFRLSVAENASGKYEEALTDMKKSLAEGYIPTHERALLAIYLENNDFGKELDRELGILYPPQRNLVQCPS